MPTPDFIPWSPEFLRKCGDDACPCCQGSGVAHGFRLYGRLCPCVHQCEWCRQPLPVDDEHFDEGRPRTYEGMPSCPTCIARMRREDALPADPSFYDLLSGGLRYRPTGKSEILDVTSRLPSDATFVTYDARTLRGAVEPDDDHRPEDNLTCDPIYILDETTVLGRK